MRLSALEFSESTGTSQMEPGGIETAYLSYDPNTFQFSNSISVTAPVLEGQTVYYVVGEDCLNQPMDHWYVDGDASHTVLFAGAIKVTWGSAGTGSVVAILSACFNPQPDTASITINSCGSAGNISEAGTGFSSGAITGALTYPAAVNAGDVIYYKAASTIATGFEVTNGTVLSIQTATGGYKVAEVEWGTAGTGTIKATIGGSCTAQNITVTTPELVFDGSDDRVTIPHVTTYNIGTGNFTIEAWIKASSTQNSTEGTIFSKRTSVNDGLWFGFDDEGDLTSAFPGFQFQWSDDVDIRDDTWHHVAMTRTSRNIAYYIDGVQVGAARTAAAPGSNLSTSADIWIGDDDPGSDNAFTGAIKGVRFWNVSRDDQELLETWKTNLNKFQVNLIGCWDMNEIDTQTQTDQSNTANNGELGSTSSTDPQDPTITPANPAPFVINALLFDGNDDRVEIPYDVAYNFGTGNFTIEAYVYVKDWFNDQTIFSKRTSGTDGIWFGIDGSSGVPVLKINGETFTSSISDLREQGWKHIAVTKSGSTISFFIGGNDNAQGTGTYLSGASVSTAADIWIGNDVLSSKGFNGLIDEVRIWNIARAGNLINAEKNATDLTGLTQTSNLKGWWRFNASVGQSDKDLSSVNKTAHLGDTNGLTAEITDPLRIANQAFIGAKKGFFHSNNFLNEAAFNVQVYPNPFVGQINVAAVGLQTAQANVVVLDIAGTEVYKATLYDEQPIVLGEDLPAGMYLVKISDGDEFKAVKIIKK